MTRPEESWQAPFTVAFSDSDVPGAGQQTVVATSTLRWNEPETFGRLVSFPGHTRYPPLEQSRWERANIEPPRRLELTAAGLPVIPGQAPSAAQPLSPAAQEPSPLVITVLLAVVVGVLLGPLRSLVLRRASRR